MPAPTAPSPVSTPNTAPIAPTAPLTPPSAAAAQAGAAPHTPGVALQHAIETVRLTIELGARGGYAQARIQLAPAELGEIRINLHQTAEGLIAKLTAADGAAAQTLQQGGAELRKSLESAGVTLLRLDISSSGQQGPSAGQSGFNGSAFGSAARDGGLADDDTTGSAATPQDATATPVELSNGVTIDVLA